MLALEVNTLQKSYHDDIVLRGIDLQIEQGRIFRFCRRQRRRQKHHAQLPA